MRSRPAPTRKITTTTAAATAAVLLAAGCGSGNPTSGSHGAAKPMSAAQAITLASLQAARVNSFTSTLSVQMSGSISGGMAGTMQLQKRPSLLVSADFSTLRANGQTMPGGMQEILTSKTLYLKLAPLAQQLGKPWAAMSLSGLRHSTGLNLSQLTQQVQENNPMTDTQMLSSAKNLRSVGTQTVDGVPATHYTGSFPVAAGVAKLPSSLRGTEQKALQTLGISTISFNAWIDAQHQIRKIVVTERGSSSQVSATMLVTSFNRPVNVSPPPASQVRTIPASALGG